MDDIVPHAQSGLTNEPVFVDFFLLQSIFTALSRLTNDHPFERVPFIGSQDFTETTLYSTQK